MQPEWRPAPDPYRMFGPPDVLGVLDPLTACPLTDPGVAALQDAWRTDADLPTITGLQTKGSIQP